MDSAFAKKAGPSAVVPSGACGPRCVRDTDVSPRSLTPTTPLAELAQKGHASKAAAAAAVTKPKGEGKKRSREESASSGSAGEAAGEGDAAPRKHRAVAVEGGDAPRKTRPASAGGEGKAVTKKKRGPPARDPEVEARTVFVGNVDVAMTTQKLADIVQAFVKAAPGYEAPAGVAAGEGKGKEGGRADVESVRFRSIPIAATAVAPGSDYGAMIKAAVAQGKLDTAGKKNSMNAYIVLRTAAAARAALGLNGLEVEGHVLRVDSAVSGQAGEAPGKGDPKRTVFVGNLPFTASEDDVRALFGSRVSGGGGAIEAVRLVRDKVTMVGKGIAFVTFKERAAVVEALGLDGADFAKRPLRVQPCTRDGTPLGRGGRGRGAAARSRPSFMGARGDDRVKPRGGGSSRGGGAFRGTGSRGRGGQRGGSRGRGGAGGRGGRGGR
jgi:nucleolar protein 12